MEISDNVRRLWRLEMMGALAVTAGFAVACPTDLITSRGTYKNMHVIAQSKHDGSDKYVMIRYAPKEREESSFLAQSASAYDKNNNGAFDPDEIKLDGFPLKDALRYQQEGARDFEPTLRFANPAEMMAAYKSAMEQGTQAKKR
jgi:hypothetical protein